MANLKRNMIELIKNPEEVAQGAEVEIEKIWTPAFISLDVTYEAMDLMDKLEADEEMSGKEVLDLLLDFVGNKIYNGQVTVDDLRKRLHAPDAIKTLQEQVLFIAQGQQSDATKSFLEKKR